MKLPLIAALHKPSPKATSSLGESTTSSGKQVWTTLLLWCSVGQLEGDWYVSHPYQSLCIFFIFFHILLLLQNFRPSSKTERISRQFTQYQVKTCGSKGHIICKIVVLAVQMVLHTTSTTGSVPP